MTTQSQTTSVRTQVVVSAPIERAFRVFVEQFDRIKPREHNLLEVEIEETVFEPRVGGHVFDRGVDGSECRWARVLAFDPPQRVVISWDIDPRWQLETDLARTSEVEIRFIAETPDRTRVELEHRHLDRHGEGWRGERDGVAGEGGWPLYLRRFGTLLAEGTVPRSALAHTGRVIREELRVDAAPDDVYRAWSDPDLIAGWFVGRMEGRLETGGTVQWFWHEAGPGTSQEVLEADPPHRFVTRMELPLGPSLLEVSIEPDGDGSLVRLVQSGYGRGPDWDDIYESMLSGWLIALAVLKIFLKHYLGRSRREIVVLADASFDRGALRELQRSEEGLSRWLTRSGAPGAEGQPVRVELEDGRTLTGTVLRTTSSETVWSWEEIDGVLELKAFKQSRTSKVGLRISSWLDSASELADLEGWARKAVDQLVAALGEGIG